MSQINIQQDKYSKKESIVGVIITNPERTRFYLQKKDDTHPVLEFRNKYAFFGGLVEKEEEKEHALKRELEEEMEEEAASIIAANINFLFEIVITRQQGPKKGTKINYIIFESVLPNNVLTDISKKPIKEGKSGEIIDLENLPKFPLIYSLSQVLKRYL